MPGDIKSAEVELGAFSEPPPQYHFNDESDMRRMGKKQEFQAC